MAKVDVNKIIEETIEEIKTGSIRELSINDLMAKYKIGTAYAYNIIKPIIAKLDEEGIKYVFAKGKLYILDSINMKKVKGLLLNIKSILENHTEMKPEEKIGKIKEYIDTALNYLNNN